jgi:hypothetical protein
MINQRMSHNNEQCEAKVIGILKEVRRQIDIAISVIEAGQELRDVGSGEAVDFDNFEMDVGDWTIRKRRYDQKRGVVRISGRSPS